LPLLQEVYAHLQDNAVAVVPSTLTQSVIAASKQALVSLWQNLPAAHDVPEPHEQNAEAAADPSIAEHVAYATSKHAFVAE
jgi:hypothetical protein